MDTRRCNSDGRYPIRLSIAKDHKTVYIGTEINLLKSEWNQSKGICIVHPHRNLINRNLQKVRLDAELVDLNLQIRDDYRFMTAQELKNRILHGQKSEICDGNGDFEEYFLKTAEKKSKSTRGVYMQTHSRLLKRFGDDLKKLRFSDITPAWLRDFESFLARTAPSANARGIHLRNIRAVFNSAIADEVTNNYPFRLFKIKTQKTAHRNLSVERLRELFSYDCEAYQRRYVDMFKLSFLLIGINMADLARLKSIEDGRINYIRCKTHTPYSIKVEPEAYELIMKYEGNNHLLDILDRYSDHNDFTRHCNRGLQSIGKMRREGRGGKKIITPFFPGLTMYWARHSWASIAKELDVPVDVIGEGLGHTDRRVTALYVFTDTRKMDYANRLVIDYVIHGRKQSWINP